MVKGNVIKMAQDGVWSSQDDGVLAQKKKKPLLAQAQPAIG